MRKYAITVARCRRFLKRYERKLDRLINGLAILPSGETYPLAEQLIALVEQKCRLVQIAEAERLMTADLTAEENDALTICVCGEGSRRAARRLGVRREDIMRSARRALDKCCKTLAGLDFSCEGFVSEFYGEMVKTFLNA